MKCRDLRAVFGRNSHINHNNKIMYILDEELHLLFEPNCFEFRNMLTRMSRTSLPLPGCHYQLQSMFDVLCWCDEGRHASRETSRCRERCVLCWFVPLLERQIWREVSVLKTGMKCYRCYLLTLAGINRGGKLAVFWIYSQGCLIIFFLTSTAVLQNCSPVCGLKMPQIKQK